LIDALIDLKYDMKIILPIATRSKTHGYKNLRVNSACSYGVIGENANGNAKCSTRQAQDE
jgi:hypothetical protein